MERKTKHRILGILVVIGLVIILLPLFQSEKESSTESTLVQAPPFPDQSPQQSAMPEPEQSQMTTPQDQDMSAVPQQLPIQDPAQSNGINPQPDDTVNPDSATQTPGIESATPAPITAPSENKTPEAPAPSTSTDQTTSSINSSQEELEPSDNVLAAEGNSNLTSQPSATIYRNSDKLETRAKEAAEKVLMTSTQSTTQEASPAKKTTHVKTAKKSSHKTVALSKKRAALAKAPLEDDGLFKLKSSVWVIQMGSFANKDNAIRLVNKLRNKGYPAFIQQIASSTRVYVGPSNKQTAARTMASRIKTDVKLEGIVISYKPLAI